MFSKMIFLDFFNRYVEALKNKYVIIIAIVMGDGGPVPLVKDLADEADTVHVEHTVTPQLAAEMAETKSCRKQFPSKLLTGQ